MQTKNRGWDNTYPRLAGLSQPRSIFLVNHEWIRLCEIFFLINVQMDKANHKSYFVELLELAVDMLQKAEVFPSITIHSA